MSMNISIGSDHRGFELKQLIIERFSTFDVDGAMTTLRWIDVGTDTSDRTDYPIFAHRVAKEIVHKRAAFGIVMCGSGVGMAIAANRHPGIYAAVCFDVEYLKTARAHDNINVLSIPADHLDEARVLELVDAMIESWIVSPFLGGRYQKRLEMIEKSSS